ncbi:MULTISPECIES: sugar transferase [unclassified Flavobacterium]|uniref:sugar transferase n=1 Tax=unclassified Flavobacterium TaxID=196869 RepID=UPI00131D64A5|nr:MULTISPECIES: sugar transferase [unclassified Flavobacterium]
MKRVFDIVFSFFGLVLLLPLFVLIIISMKITTKGPIIYKQLRVGKNNNDFFIFKFRTMFVNADKLGLLTVGERDPRVTKIGFYLRKYKLDELPQLINVFCGDMSFVGPRPEVRKYVDLYNPMQMQVLNVRPGITDLASIEFRNENELLSCQENPDRYYIEVVMPQKLQINLNYLEKRNLIKDIGVIISTFWSIFKN